MFNAATSFGTYGLPEAHAAVSGYRLPWSAGLPAYMSWGAVGHRYLAADFDIQGSSTAGIVRAAKGGTVRFRKDTSQRNCPYNSATQTWACSWQYANIVVIEHPGSEFSWYMHLAPGTIPAAVQEGSAVAQGAILGVEGNTGWATGVHLHFHVTTTYAGVSGTGDLRAPIWQESFQEVNFAEYSWQAVQVFGWKTSQNSGGNSATCPAPVLNSPAAGQVLSDRNVAFSWNGVSCGQGFTFRIKNVATMDAGGSTIVDTGEGGTSRQVSIPDQWLNQDLYWGVRAANAAGAQWAVRSFRIQPGNSGGDACTPSADQAAIYVDINYTGSCSRLNINNYSDTGALNIANDAVSSLRVGSNVRLVLCRDGNYGGTCETFSGDDADLRDNQIGNDQASSGRVERRVSNDPCPGPALAGPADGAVSGNPNVNFSWSAPNGCAFNGYTLRIKDTPDMERGGTVIFDDGIGATSADRSIPAQWQGRDLYWGVRTANPLSPNWSVHRFRIETPSETDPQSLSSGQRIDARLDPANEDDTFTFNATAGQVATVTMTKIDASDLDSYVELFGPNGLVGYNDDNGGLDSRLVATLPQTGNYRIIAHSFQRASGGNYRLGFDLTSASVSSDSDDGAWLSYGNALRGTISPSADRDTYYFTGVAGRTISLRMTKQVADLDSFVELYDPNGTKVGENDDGGGDYNSWLVTNLTSAGTYRVVARSFNSASSGAYNISLDNFSGGNLALDKQAYASSYEDGNASLAPGMATDGNRSTRWSSAFTDNQWLYVDLGEDKSINQVVLRWEAAFADRYDIYVRGANESSWRVVYQTDSADGNIDTISFTPTTARYVAMVGRHRYAYYGWQQFGYSLWELEVFNTLTALVPTVPPDTEEKPPETLVPLVPLPPQPEGKEEPVFGAGSEQENTPAALSDTNTPAPNIEPGEIYGPPTTGLELSADRVVTGRDALTLMATNAHDNDQQGNGIVAYRWTSDIDGFLGDRAVMTISTQRLAVGIHVISLEVQDNEGNWSIPAQALLEVQATPDTQQEWQVYLPLVTR